jgi:PP-loop superfamily ATP-utilizing enzyme
MSDASLHQLRELAGSDQALQLALAGATDAAEVQAIANQRGIQLNDSAAQQWLADAAPMAAELSPEELEAISEGLSLTDEDLAAVAGGQTGGEAIIGLAGEAC